MVARVSTSYSARLNGDGLSRGIPASLSIGLACVASLLLVTIHPAVAWPFAWVVPALILQPTLNRSIARAAMVSGFGVSSIALLLSWWMPWTMIHRFGAEVGAAGAIWLIGGLSHFPAAALFGALTRWVGVRSPLYPLVAGLGWGGMELSWELIWPALPSWAAIAPSQIDTTLASLAAIVGVYGVGAVVATGSALGLQLVAGSRAGVPTSAALALAVGIALGTAERDPSALGPTSARLAALQPAVRMPDPGYSSVYQQQLLDVLIEQTERLYEHVDYVVWPEGVLIDPLGDRPDLTQRIQELVNRIRVPIVLGSARKESEQHRVSIALFRPYQLPAPVYDKRKPVPFSESWPEWAPVWLRPHLGWMVPVPPTTPGMGLQAAARSLPFDLSLCWESAFSAAIRPGADALLLNLVNDGWYDETPAAAQMLLLSRWRAVEHATWLVRVAATGISAVVRPSGEIASSLALGQRGALIAPVQHASSMTLFERHGYGPLMGALASVILLALLLRGWQRRDSR
jgi:apolipoprotein N-acyltransferase